MSGVDLLPVEVLYHILSYLDRESLLIASKVCAKWRLLIHEWSWQFLSNSCSRSSRQQQQLLKMMGWQEECPSYKTCRSIDIHLDCFPFRKCDNMKTVKERCNIEFQSFQPTCAITNSKVFLGRTVTGTGELQTTDILVYDRDDPESDPPVLTSYNDATEIHLYSHDNSLLILERRAVENMITSIININNFKLSIWNSATNDFTSDVEFLDFLDDVPRENVHTEISDVAVVDGIFAVHVFVTNLDWLLPDEILHNPQSNNITLFWSLDTHNPSPNNLNFKTLIRKSLVEDSICDTGFIFMNRRYFCRYLSGLYNTADDLPRFATKLQVFDMTDLENTKPWIVDVNEASVKDFEDCNDDSMKLEPGISNRMAAYNANKKSFKIINIEDGSIIQFIDFNTAAGPRPRNRFSTWQFHDANWCFDKFVFLQERPGFETQTKSFQLIIFTMEKNKTDHLLNLPNFLIGNSLKCDMEKDLMIVPSDKIYADLKGIVIATEEFFVMSSFQTNV